MFEFDQVVVTMPLGWLKKNPRAFVPPLPDRLSRAIGNIGYGCLEKVRLNLVSVKDVWLTVQVYLSFPTGYWLQPDVDGRTFRGFCQWLGPEFAPDTNPKKWTIEVVELASLSPFRPFPTLLFYLYGDISRHIVTILASCSTQAEKDKFLVDFFRPYYSRLPNYNPTDPGCQPSGAFATTWLDDEFAGNGSYCNFQVGLEEGDKDLLAMREGVPAEGIWFAGEHTAPFVALGTATGAYWSGELIAKRIANVYGQSKSM